MDRLTIPDVKVDAHTTRRTMIDAEAVKERAMEIYWKLKKYEDTGLTPAEVLSMSAEWCAMMSVLNSIGSYDRLRELAEADRDGRVVVLPCKVGDTVWMFEEDFGIVLPYTIDLISFVGKGCGYSANCNHNGELIDSIDFEDDDIGKTVFRTREEAEKALEEAKRDG